MNRVSEILGVKYPIIQAPMGWIARSQLASAVSNDEFLKMHVIEIQQDSVGYFLLKIRALDWEVELGDLSELEQKITKFKAFYQKAKKEDMLHAYSRINLKFKQQVVCTKK